MDQEDTRDVDDAYEGHMAHLAEEEDIRKAQEKGLI